MTDDTTPRRKYKPRLGVHRITFDAPPYVIDSLRDLALERGTTVRFLMLQAIKAHYQIELAPADRIADNRVIRRKTA